MKLTPGINSNFIYLAGKANHTRKSIKSQFKTTSGQKTINHGHIDSFIIPLPPLAEQNRIAQKSDELMQYCNELEASTKQNESQNEKLLQQVLREALRPVLPIAGKEPVGV
jgi:type I restriction enzyme, S subunit